MAVAGHHARLGTRLRARLCRGLHFRRLDSMSFQGTTLIEPDRRISRIRLSEKTHTELGRHVTPSATSEHNRGVARLVVNPRVLCCFLRQSLTEASSLPRHSPASSVLQASPSPQAAQPASHEVPVDRQGDHRWGFPCCYWSTLPTCRRHYPGRSDGTRSLVLFHQRRPAHITRGEGSCVNRFEACSAFTSRYGLHARQVTYVTLYTGGSDGFVSSTAAPIASGWSEPSSRAGLSPAVDQRFSRRTRNGDLTSIDPSGRSQLPPPSLTCATPDSKISAQ